MSTPTAERSVESLSAEAAEVLADARRHKRLAAHHRRQARQSMARLELLRTLLAGVGVRLVIPGEAPEEERHGRRSTPDP